MNQPVFIISGNETLLSWLLKLHLLVQDCGGNGEMKFSMRTECNFFSVCAKEKRGSIAKLNCSFCHVHLLVV